MDINASDKQPSAQMNKRTQWVYVLGLCTSVFVSGQAWGGESVYFNDGTDNGCRAVRDGGRATPSLPNNAAKCSSNDKSTQSDRALFYDPNGGMDKSTSLTLGGELYVNSGRLGLGGANDGKIAIGSQTTLDNQASNGGNSVAVGTGVSASGNQAVSIGAGATATGNQTVSIGQGAKATKADAFALGENSFADGQNSLSLGAESKTNSTYNISIGRKTETEGTGAIAIGGGDGAANDPNDFKGAQALKNGAIAIGGKGNATNRGAQAKESFSVSLGSGSIADKRASVALGSSSVADTAEGIQGYDPLNRATQPSGVAWKSTLGAVSVGNATNTRQITNVAAGTQDTDAVNVAQLKTVTTLATSDLTFAGDSGTNVDRKLSETLNIKGGEATASNLTDNNIGVVADGTNTLNIKLAKDLKDLNSVKIGSGSNVTTLTSNANGLDIGGRKITNLAAGTNPTDAVNLSQLNASKTQYFSVNSTTSVKSLINASDPSNKNNDTATGPLSLAAGYQAKASGNRSTAVGNTAVASGLRSTAVGRLATATTNDASAYGYWSKALGVRSTAIGSGAEGQKTNATAVGYKAIAGGLSSSAFGVVAKATGNDSSAFGVSADASGLRSTALGRSAKAQNSNASALGYGANASEVNSTAIGFVAKSTGRNATTLGARAIANNTNATAVGYGAKAENVSSSAFGTAAKASERDASAFGVSANATGLRSTAVGKSAKAQANETSAFGYGAKASGVNATAIGRTATASGANAVAVGTRSISDKQNTTAVGYGAKARNDNASAFGFGANATGLRSTAIGRSARGTQTNATALGYASKADGVDTTALGYGAKAVGERSISIGRSSETLGSCSVSIGSYSDATKIGAIATGYGAQAQGEYSLASGYGADAKANYSNAIGFDAQANSAQSIAIGRLSRANTHTGSIALGSESVATVNAGVVGYDPSTGLPSTATNTIWRSNRAALSVGNGTAITRQITSVAAGTNDTDAVNVAQLKTVSQLATSDLIFAGDGGTNVGRKLGETVNIKGGQTDATKLSDNNIGVVADGTDTLNIKLSKELTGLTSVQAGDSTLNTNGLVIIGGPSVIKTGINAANTKIINVSNGTNANDAVNYSQLQAVSNAANAGFNIAGNSDASGTTDKVIKPTDTLSIVGNSANTDFTQSDTGRNIYTQISNNQVRIGLANNLNVTSIQTGDTRVNDNGLVISNGPSVTKSGIDAGDNKLVNVAAGTVSATSKDAVNGSQLFAQGNSIKNILGGNAQITNGVVSTTNIGNTGQNNIHDAIASINTAAGQRSTVSSGQNISVVTSTNANGSTNYQIKTSDNVNFDSVTVGNVVIDQNTGINAGNNTITNVASGLNGRTVADIKAQGSSAAEWNNAATVGDLTQVAGSVTNINNVVGGSDVNDPTVKDSLKTYDVSGQTSTNNNTVISAIKNMNEGGIKYFHTNDNSGQRTGGAVSSTADSSASGRFSTAIGYRASATSENALAIGNGAQATGVNSISIGTGNVVSGNNSGALGDPSTITGSGSYVVGNNNTIAADNAFVMGNEVTVAAGNDGAVVLGHQSTVDSVHTGNYTVAGQRNAQVAGQTGSGTQVVSIGRVGGERQLQNVAPGVVSANSTDAINGSQLYHSINEIKTNVGNVYQTVGRIEKNANAGVASAIAVANLPQPHDPGASMTSIAVGNYRDESALSLGVSTISDNGKWVLKGSFTQDTQDNRSYGAGVGFQW